MGCRCNERGQAITRIARAASTGKTETIATDLKFIATSAVQDTASMLREKTNAARARLQQRRR